MVRRRLRAEWRAADHDRQPERREQSDRMVRTLTFVRVADWLIAYVVRQPRTSRLSTAPWTTCSRSDRHLSATAATARRLADRSATHKAIVVLTDGIDTTSKLTAAEVSGLASSIDVPVYIVATVPSVDQIALMEGTERSGPSTGADLRDLAEWTGGQFVFAANFMQTVVAASSLIHELRQQYVLAIEAAKTPEWRRLQVRVRQPSATVKARSGYFGG